MSKMSGQNRRASDQVVLPVYLVDDAGSVGVADGMADGELVGFGFRPYLDRDRTVELTENDGAAVLPGVFFTRVAGVTFHDSALQLPHFRAGRPVEIRPEPANATDRNALAVFGGGVRVGYVPSAISASIAPAGTRIGRGLVVKEWSSNGVRRDIWVLGSMHVNLSVTTDT